MNILTNIPWIYVSMFFASLTYVAARSFQQINVQKKIYVLIPFVSIVMAFLDVFVMSMIVKHSSGDLTAVALVMGLGGGCGSMLAVYAHDKLVK